MTRATTLSTVVIEVPFCLRYSVLHLGRLCLNDRFKQVGSITFALLVSALIFNSLILSGPFFCMFLAASQFFGFAKHVADLLIFVWFLYLLEYFTQ